MVIFGVSIRPISGYDPMVSLAQYSRLNNSEPNHNPTPNVRNESRRYLALIFRRNAIAFRTIGIG